MEHRNILNLVRNALEDLSTTETQFIRNLAVLEALEALKQEEPLQYQVVRMIHLNDLNISELKELLSSETINQEDPLQREIVKMKHLFDQFTKSKEPSIAMIRYQYNKGMDSLREILGPPPDR